MNRVIVIAILLFFQSFTWAQEYEQIIAKENIVNDTFFNKYIIEDKFRWLEDINSTQTKEWIEYQNQMSKVYLTKASNTTNSYITIDNYAVTEFRYTKKMGNYYFHYAYYNAHATPALFFQSSLNGDGAVLVDPNFISLKDNITLNGYSVSKDSKLLAYRFSRNGSDWNEIKVISLQTGLHKEDHLTGIKFSNIEWMGDGFFYSTFSQDAQFGETKGQRVFYHTIGTDQQQDKLIFERKNNLSLLFSYLTSSDEQYFILNEKNVQTEIMNIFYIDYKSDNPSIKPLITNQKSDIDVLDSHDGKFIANTLHDSNNGSIVEIDPANPYKWRAIAPGFSEALLLKAIPFKDRIVAIYQSNQRPIITIYDYSGTILFTLTMPMGSSVKGFSGNSSDEEMLYYYTSFISPPVVYKFNIKTFKKQLTTQTKASFTIDDIEYKEVEYLSKDSVAVPMILVYEKGIKLDGKNPTVLKAYGGFDIVEPPTFDPGIVYFIKSGGIFAFANIRGGGDKGIKWAKAGKGKNKQKSFDDFIAAAEYLINNNYTSKDKLAATGASNGGLVVAAATIQRPDLFKAVVPVVAPLDMLRFEQFTAGHWWIDEYGTVKDSVSFTRLNNFSPYHNVKEEINYPSMLVVTSDNDDRVPPFHSFKFVARLQGRSAQKNPILLRIEKNSGHNGASTWTSSVREEADIYGFIMNELMKK